jgi:hypothetical protein
MNCMGVGDTAGFTVSYGNGLEITPGQNFNGNIVWSTGGWLPGNVTMISSGTFIANAESPRHGDTYIIASDPVRNLTDTLGVIIAPAFNPPCVSTNDQVWAQTIPTLNHNLLAVKARMKACFGRLCGTPYDGLRPASIVWVALSDTTTQWHGDNIWAQGGYANVRLENDQNIGAVYQCPYSEFQGSDSLPAQRFQYYTHIAQGDINEYAVEILPATGVARFFMDGNVYYETDPDPLWLNNAGNQAHWQTEVVHGASDMAGVANAPCFFAACSTKVIGGQGLYQGINLQSQTQIDSDNRYEWDYLLSNDTLYIWDVNPLP